MVQSWRVKPASDEALRDLMVAYQHGDLEAFDWLYVALEPELRGFLRARAHDPSCFAPARSPRLGATAGQRGPNGTKEFNSAVV